MLLTDISRLAGCSPASVGESHQSTQFLKCAETSRNPHQFLKAKSLYSALHVVDAEVQNDLKAFLQESAVKNRGKKKGLQRS